MPITDEGFDECPGPTKVMIAASCSVLSQAFRADGSPKRAGPLPSPQTCQLLDRGCDDSAMLSICGSGSRQAAAHACLVLVDGANLAQGIRRAAHHRWHRATSIVHPASAHSGRRRAPARKTAVHPLPVAAQSEVCLGQSSARSMLEASFSLMRHSYERQH